MDSSINEYTQRVKGDKTTWLGQVVSYRVAEATRIEHTKLGNQLGQLGLQDFTPKVPQDIDVFRRVASSKARKRVPTANPDVFENYLIRDVGRGSGKAVKQIVVEQVDSNNRRLAYSPAVQLAFENGKVDQTVLVTGADAKQAINLADLIVIDYEAERGHLNSYSLRDMLRRILGASKATPFMTGGLYFVWPEFTPRVDAIEKLEIEGLEVHSLPLIDDRKQREMLRKSIESETNEAMDSLLKEIEEIEKGDGDIKMARFQSLSERRSEIVAKAKDYAAQLDDVLDMTTFRIDMVNNKLRQLFISSVTPDE